MRKVYKSIMVCIMIMMIGLTGCQELQLDGENSNASATGTKKKITIGLSVDQEFESRVNVTNAIKLAATKKNMLVKEAIANGDARTQSMQIRTFIEARVDAILVCAVDQNSIIDVLEEAKKKGIPIVAFDRELPHVEVVDAYIGPDSVMDGKLCGEAMIEHFQDQAGPIVVLELVGALNDQNGIDRSKGWNQTLEKEVLANSEDKKFRVVQMPTDWDTQSATEAVQNAFQSVDNVAAVFCATDSFIPSVNTVLDKLRMQGVLEEDSHVFINGINGSHDGYEAVRSGKADGFVVMDLETTGEKAIELVDKLVSGEIVERVNKVTSNYYTQANVEANRKSIWGAN